MIAIGSSNRISDSSRSSSTSSNFSYGGNSKSGIGTIGKPSDAVRRTSGLFTTANDKAVTIDVVQSLSRTVALRSTGQNSEDALGSTAAVCRLAAGLVRKRKRRFLRRSLTRLRQDSRERSRAYGVQRLDMPAPPLEKEQSCVWLAPAAICVACSFARSSDRISQA